MSFPTVIWIVVLVVAPVAAVLFAGSFGLLDQLGRGGLSMDRDESPRGPAPGSAQFRAEADAEIRQLVEAKSARRVARGEQPLDVEAEIQALTQPAPADAGLREEVRQLVQARNERRIRRGQEPLDVEAEIDRQLRDLGA